MQRSQNCNKWVRTRFIIIQHNSSAVHKDHSLFPLDELALHSPELNFDLRLFALQVSAPPFAQQQVQRL
jgi:hypothetical protein